MMISKKTTYIPNNGNLKVPSREEYYRRFSGVIYLSDFDYPTSLTSMASKIVSNLKFDESCKRNAELKGSTKKIIAKSDENNIQKETKSNKKIRK